MSPRIVIVAIGALALAAPALALPSNVDSTNKYSWSENCGWMNWRDAGSPTPPNPSQGAFIGPTFLAGFIWGENTDGTNGFSVVWGEKAVWGANTTPVGEATSIAINGER